MTSMTDYVEDVGIDIGLERPLSEGGDYTRPFKTIKGATLARNFVLQGGVLSDFATNAGDGQRKVKQGKDVRGGFPQSGKTLNTSYGDASIGANNSDDGYGIVPMPGIVDATIRTKSAYGSLREAKVNFVVHSRRQLEVLEMLYMRPGYAVLLEWGWSPYINNNGKIESSLNVVQDEIGEDVLFSNQVTQDLLFQTVKQLKESQDGNYDGMLGYVKNFGFSQSNEGAYNCFIELISLGEVLDSLKSQNKSPLDTSTIKFSTTGSNAQFNFGLDSIDGLVAGLDLLGDKLSIIQEAESAYNLGLISNLDDEIYSDGNYYSQLKKARAEAKTDIKTYLELLGLDPTQIQNSFFSITKDVNQTTAFVAGTTDIDVNGDSFVRWDMLCFLLNESFVNPDARGSFPTFLSPDKIIDEGKADEFRVQPLLYVPNYHPDPSKSGELLDLSGNPDVCILPHQFKNAASNMQSVIDGNARIYTVDDNGTLISYVFGFEDITNKKRYESFINYATNQDLTKFNFRTYEAYIDDPTSFARFAHYRQADGTNVGGVDPDGQNFPATTFSREDAQRRIGNIFLSVNMLKSILQGKDRSEVTLGGFVRDIWDRVNEACPLHNFVVSDDSENKYSYVYDLGIEMGTTPALDDLYEFQPGTNQTTVRDYDIQSTVPSSLSSTIAIQAQDPKGINDIDGVTFRAFNSSIKNRLISNNTEGISVEEQAGRLRNDLLTRLSRNVAQIENYSTTFFTNLVGRNINTRSDEANEFFNGINSLNPVGSLKQIQTDISYLLTQQYKTPSAASVIPLSVNMTIDGIGGIVKGHMFKIEPDRLPKAYEKSNIGFITFGEEQMITVGGDWTTKLEGKMTILPDTVNKAAIAKGTIEDFIQYNAIQGSQTADFTYYWSVDLMTRRGTRSLYWYLQGDRANLRRIQQRDYPDLIESEFPTNLQIMEAYKRLYPGQFSFGGTNVSNEVVLDVTIGGTNSGDGSYFIYDYVNNRPVEYVLEDGILNPA